RVGAAPVRQDEPGRSGPLRRGQGHHRPEPPRSPQEPHLVHSASCIACTSASSSFVTRSPAQASAYVILRSTPSSGTNTTSSRRTLRTSRCGIGSTPTPAATSSRAAPKPSSRTTPRRPATPPHPPPPPTSSSRPTRGCPGTPAHLLPPGVSTTSPANSPGHTPPLDAPARFIPTLARAGCAAPAFG